MLKPIPHELKRRAIDAYMSRDDPNFDGALDAIYAAGIAADLHGERDGLRETLAVSDSAGAKLGAQVRELTKEKAEAVAYLNEAKRCVAAYRTKGTGTPAAVENQIEFALESLQPASAKADERCTIPAPNHVLVTFSCEHCHNRSKSNMRGQDVGAHAVRYYEHHKACAELPVAPRVSEEEQGIRWRQITEAAQLILDCVPGYRRAEREGRSGG